jgi:hypothetical protein
MKEPASSFSDRALKLVQKEKIGIIARHHRKSISLLDEYGFRYESAVYLSRSR